MGDSKKETIIQYIKFNIVGILNTLLAFLVYTIITYVSGSYFWGLLMDYLFGIIFSYVANKVFTFKDREKTSPWKLLKFTLLYAGVFVINYLMLDFAIKKYNFNPYISQFVVFAVLSVGLFTAQKIFIFSRDDKKNVGKPV